MFQYMSGSPTKFPDDERFKIYKVYKKHKSTSILSYWLKFQFPYIDNVSPKIIVQLPFAIPPRC